MVQGLKNNTVKRTSPINEKTQRAIDRWGARYRALVTVAEMQVPYPTRHNIEELPEKGWGRYKIDAKRAKDES